MSFSLKEQINTYISGINHKFEAEEIYNYIQQHLEEKVPHLAARIDNFLSESRYVFYNEEKDFYIPRNFYFKGSRFLVSPSVEEIMSGMLIPGHRFIPFCNLDNFPGEYTLLLPDGSEIPKKKIKKKVEELFIYLSLLDLYTLPDYLIYDSESNRELFENEELENQLAQITVFDLENFYEKHNFRIGDALLLEVEDWNKGIYRINFSPATLREGKQKEITKWIKKLDTSFDNLFIEEGIRTKIDEQIAKAYHNAGRFIIENPLIHLGGYLDKTELVKIIALGEKHVLWYMDEEPGPEDFIHLDEITGTFESLDDILMDINSPVSSNELEAFMRDELFSRTNDYNNVIQNCFGNMELTFFDEFQEEKCFQYIKELWAQVKGEYNFFTDQARGAIRKKGLEVFKYFNKHFSEIEKKFSSIQESIQAEDILEVTNVLNNLFSVLGFCNEESRIVDDEATHINEVLDSIEGELKRLINSIETKLKPELSLVRHDHDHDHDHENCNHDHNHNHDHEDSNHNTCAFIIKITIKGSKPPIWRRIQVPGDMTLAALHNIIQIAFGWEQSHMHDFKIASIIYGTPSEDSWAEIVNEQQILLSSVFTDEKQKFTYTYDYGDNWEHMAVVEKIIQADAADLKGKEKVICLAGKRACPPEDCGGIPGYEEMLFALHDKNHPQYDSYAEWIEEGFDPEYFNLDAINRELAEIKTV